MAVVCEAADCEAGTKGGKPYCKRHILLMPYAQEVARRLRGQRAVTREVGRAALNRPKAKRSRKHIQTMQNGRIEAVKRGIRSGPAPYGYTRGPDKRFTPEPTQASVVRRIFEDLVAGKSVSHIARELNQEGIPTKRNGSWVSVQVQHILCCRVYLGEVSHGELVTPGAHPPLVSEDLFARVERELERRTRRRAQRQVEVALRVVDPDVCGGCGEPFERRHGLQKYCDRKCETRAYRARQRAKKTA